MSNVTVEVTSHPVSVSVDGESVTVEVGTSGPQGPQGPPGTNLSFEYTQASPLATWTIPVPSGFDSRPSVTVFLDSGESVIADVSASSSSVTITFASPVSGSAVLS